MTSAVENRLKAAEERLKAVAVAPLIITAPNYKAKGPLPQDCIFFVVQSA